MADMKVSIKKASDEQLTGIMYRLENESRVQELIKRIRRNSIEVDYRSEPQHVEKGVSLTKPVDELYHANTDTSVSIKKASDENLIRIMNRLRNENRVQNLIRSIRRDATEYNMREYMDTAVTTEKPITELYHFGVLGMRWGRRKGSDGSYSKTGKKGKNKKEDIKKISDAELRTKLNRLQMEAQYSKLTSNQRNKGRSIVKSMLGEIGKEVAKDILRETIKVGTDPAKAAIKTKVKTALDIAVTAAKLTAKG